MMSAFAFVQVRETEGWDEMRALHDAMHAVADSTVSGNRLGI